MKPGTVSIIIPCFNQVGFTRRCVESILRHSEDRYELILVDNGSADGTAGYFHELEARSGLPLTLIRNMRNNGVSGALNQGIAAAHGDYVCYLNNDTLATRGWLDGLRACAQSDARIGIVGCCTNPPAASESGFHDIDGLRSPQEVERTAALISLVKKGQVKEAHYIHGFCMFIKREVIEKIGLFDERFFPCGCEDFDYSLRCRQAGYRLVNAQDVYVYHFHHRSTEDTAFSGSYRQIDDVTQAMQRVFVGKWGTAGEDFLRELARIIEEEHHAQR